jgi:hypothetical protein
LEVAKKRELLLLNRRKRNVLPQSGGKQGEVGEVGEALVEGNSFSGGTSSVFG